MDAAIYLLCALTALLCCILLLRGHLRSHAPLLLWSGLCFGFKALDNLFLVLDRILFPKLDLSIHFTALPLVAVALLLYGLILKTE